MPDKILVAYATRTGSTVGVAEAIGAALTGSGAEVDLRLMADVDDLTPYSAVVAGSAIRGGKWLPEAMQFMNTHQDALKRVPFAPFLVCITMSMTNEQFLAGVAEWMEPVRALVKPVSEGYFAGALDLAKLPRMSRKTIGFQLAIALRIWAPGDHRDWIAIQTWANTLPAKFQLWTQQHMAMA